MDLFTNDQDLNHVKCHVDTCKYHGGEHRCTANKITVANEHSHRADETFCSTFVMDKQHKDHHEHKEHHTNKEDTLPGGVLPTDGIIPGADYPNFRGNNMR